MAVDDRETHDPAEDEVGKGAAVVLLTRETIIWLGAAIAKLLQDEPTAQELYIKFDFQGVSHRIDLGVVQRMSGGTYAGPERVQ